MKFITPQLIKTNMDLYLNELFVSKYDNVDEINEVDKVLYKKYEITKVNEQPIYFYGANSLDYLYKTFQYDDTSKTIATLATDIDTTITNYTDLSSETFVFQFQNLLDTKKLFVSSLWWSIYTDEGLIFTKPKKTSTSTQITTYTFLSRNKKEDYFDNISYEGETGYDFTISANVDVVVPDSIDDTEKTMVLNKFKSSNDIIIIQTSYDALPLDFVIYENNDYIVMNKKTLKTDDTAELYEYMCIKEVDETYTFSGSAVEPPVHPLIGTGGGGGGGTIVDEYTHSGASTNAYYISGLDLITDWEYEWIVDFNHVGGSNGWRVQFNTPTPSGTMSYYAVHTQTQINGYETYSIANNENRLFANDSNQPYGFRALIRQNPTVSGGYYIQMQTHHLRYRSAYNTDRILEQTMYYRTNVYGGLTSLLLSSWTGGNVIVAGFKSLLLKHRI